MRLALELAKKGKGKTWPNPHVGCVIVKHGKLLAKGFHEKAGFPHAEIEALNRAGTKARGSILYVTLEPCNHQGKTGPCSQAILRAGVKRVVAAAPDPNQLAHGGLSFLRRHGVEVGPWVLRAEAEASNLDFFRSSKLGRPWFILKAGASLDGKTALASGESKWITSEAARKDARSFRQTCDAVLVGAGTVLKDNPRLLPQKVGAFIPWRIVLDPRARLTGRERIFKDRYAYKSVWLVGPGLSTKRERLVRGFGAEIVKLKSRPLSGFVRETAGWMSNRPLRRVLVEGGSQTLGAFLSAGLCDELLLYLAPRLMGGERSKGIFGGLGAKSMHALLELKEVEVSKIGPDLKVKAYVHRNY
jgi:diaminohydroxyphosphoribosylaminopyrimidine deaminase/5-amino-6-(5-phosphoribosylamino)uracil reductase